MKYRVIHVMALVGGGIIIFSTIGLSLFQGGHISYEEGACALKCHQDKILEVMDSNVMAYQTGVLESNIKCDFCHSQVTLDSVDQSTGYNTNNFVLFGDDGSGDSGFMSIWLYSTIQSEKVNGMSIYIDRIMENGILYNDKTTSQIFDITLYSVGSPGDFGTISFLENKPDVEFAAGRYNFIPLEVEPNLGEYLAVKICIDEDDDLICESDGDLLPDYAIMPFGNLGNYAFNNETINGITQLFDPRITFFYENKTNRMSVHLAAPKTPCLACHDNSYNQLDQPEESHKGFDISNSRSCQSCHSMADLNLTVSRPEYIEFNVTGCNSACHIENLLVSSRMEYKFYLDRGGETHNFKIMAANPGTDFCVQCHFDIEESIAKASNVGHYPMNYYHDANTDCTWCHEKNKNHVADRLENGCVECHITSPGPHATFTPSLFNTITASDENYRGNICYSCKAGSSFYTPTNRTFNYWHPPDNNWTSSRFRVYLEPNVSVEIFE